MNGSEQGLSRRALRRESPRRASSPRNRCRYAKRRADLGLDTETFTLLDIGDPGCSCTATSCTFNACSFGATNNNGSVSFKIDGSYSWGGGHVCSDLEYTFSATTSAGGLPTNTVVTLNCDPP